MVADFEKQYNALKVPYPKDTMTANVDKQAAEQKANFEKFVADSKTRVGALAAEAAKWEAMKCPTLMTKEEAMDNCPELLAFHPDEVSYWPHDTKIEDWQKMIDNLEEEEH